MKPAHSPSASARASTRLATPTHSQAQLRHAGRALRAGLDPVGWFIVPQRTSGFYQEERRPPPRRDMGSGPPVQGHGESRGAGPGCSGSGQSLERLHGPEEGAGPPYSHPAPLGLQGGHVGSRSPEIGQPGDILP